MSKFIENDLEQAVMEWFQDLGYQTQYGPDISPGGSFSERESFGDVVLYDRLHSALKRINKQYSNDTISELVKKDYSSAELIYCPKQCCVSKIINRWY